MENEVYELNPVVAYEPYQAKLNITYAAQTGDLQDAVAYDLPDAQIIEIAREALRQGIPGIRPQANVNLTGFVVERYASTADRPWNQIVLRPKTEFGF